MFKTRNPFPQAPRDHKRLRAFYRDFQLVPFAGTTKGSSHLFLRILNDFYELSPSHAACIEDISFWCFEGDLAVVRDERPGLRIDEEEPQVSPLEATAFYDYLESMGIKFPMLIDLTQRLFTNLKKTGNAYLHYIETEINGIVDIQLKVIDPMQAMYLLTEPGQPKTIVISNDFFNRDGFQDEPKLVRAYPSFTESAGQRQTIFHVKHQRDHSEWYGRPDSLSSLYWQFIEWATGNLNSKVANSELGLKALLLAQAPPLPGQTAGPQQNSGLRVFELAEALRYLGTNRGSHDEMETIGVLEYPQEVAAPKLEKLEINRDAEWMKAILIMASDIIFGTHRWSKVLNGWERASAGIGGNMLIDEFLTKNTSTIKPHQNQWERFWKIVFAVPQERNPQGAQFNHLGIDFQDNVSSLVESLKEAQSSSMPTDVSTENIVEPGGSNPVQQDPEGGNASE